MLWAQAFYAISSLTVLRHLVSHVRSQTTSQGHSVQLWKYMVSIIMLVVLYATNVFCVCDVLVAL